ncbi:hypothetical protein D3C84_1304800 [compost metagenome]
MALRTRTVTEVQLRFLPLQLETLRALLQAGCNDFIADTKFLDRAVAAIRCADLSAVREA